MLITFFLVACIALYDLYYPVFGRGFDLLAVAAILIWHLSKHGLRLTRALWIAISIGITLTAIFIVRGGEVRHLIGLLLTVLFFALYRDYFRINKEKCWYGLQIVAIAIAMVFFLQLAIFVWLDHPLDITASLGATPSRVFNQSTNYFRAASVYQEPNSYCVFAFVVASLLMANRRKDTLAKCTFWLMLVTMILSQSLWGMCLSILLVLFSIFGKYIAVKSLFFVSFICFVLLSSPLWYHERTSNRILNLGKDPTVIERYYGAAIVGDVDSQNILAPRTVAHISNIGTKNWTGLIFGNGLYPRGFQQAYGASAWSYLFYNLGLLGTLLFIWFVVRFDRTKFHIGAICVLLLCTSFPYFTYLIFALFVVMLYDGPAHRAAVEVEA